MKINEVDLSGSTKVLTSSDIYTLANANLLVNANASSTPIIGVFMCKAEGSTQVIGTEFGGSSHPLKVLQPSYYPKAMMGSECGAVVTDLSWANSNLEGGYQFVKTNRGWFVSGILNSTQTDANDPFTSTLIVIASGTGQSAVRQVACWKEDYEVTYNPFQ